MCGETQGCQIFEFGGWSVVAKPRCQTLKMFSDPVCDLGSWTPTLRRRGSWFQERVYIEGLPQSHCTKTSLIFKALNTEESRNDGLSYPLPQPCPFRAPSCCRAWLPRRYQLCCDSFWARYAIQLSLKAPSFSVVHSLYLNIKPWFRPFGLCSCQGGRQVLEDQGCEWYVLYFSAANVSLFTKLRISSAGATSLREWGFAKLTVCLIRVPQIHD
jgi:hypothetical protein